MSHSPEFESFAKLAADHTFVPVYRRLASDILTPVSAFHKLDDESGSCLFESVIGGEQVGRYSFLASCPFMQFTASGDSISVTRGAEVTTTASTDPLEELRRSLQQYTAAEIEELPPFVAGAVGYAAYDIIRYSERLESPPPDDRNLPDLSFAFYDRIVVFDHVKKTVIVVVMAHTENGAADAQAAYDDAVSRLDALVEQLVAPAPQLAAAEIGDVQCPPLQFESNFQQADFESAVEKCVEYIRAGDIFQVVISQRLAVPISSPPFEIYRTLRTVNPSPFMFFLRTPSVTLVGSSPEIMCRVVDDTLTVRPLAGTRPRGETPAEDARLAEELLADPKEIAEHVMLVDLGRNDVGRVAQFGSVELKDVMTIERYSHVMHITSNVNGRLRPEYDAFDALRASLPAGTVSGAPKVRAMEIIDEVEPHRRGPYAGAVGYFDFNGNMDTCITLRTIVINGEVAHVQAGAGIVADSVPATEYQETMNKARGLLRAIELTEHRCARA